MPGRDPRYRPAAAMILALAGLSGSASLAHAQPDIQRDAQTDPQRDSNGLRFHVPDGWLDLSPGAPAASFARAPAGLAAAARATEYAVFAVDLREPVSPASTGTRSGSGSPDTTGFPTMAAIEKPVAMHVDSEALDGIAAGLADQAHRAGASCTVVESSVVAIDGVPSGRLVTEVTSSGTTLRQLDYVIPGGDRTAILTFVAPLDRFTAERPVFEAAAEATTGAAEPHQAPVPGAFSVGERIGRIFGLVIPLLFVGFVLARRRRRQS